MQESFLKLNPRHQVPVLTDGDFVITESFAIAQYLVDSRAPGSPLYPKDPKVRALINERLLFDAATAYNRNRGVIRALLFGEITKVTEERREPIRDYMNT